MSSRARAWLVSLVVLIVSALPARARKQETGFLDRKLTVAGVEYKYQVFVPDDWTRAKKWPVILFLHGAGERGDDGLLETEAGLPAAVRRDRHRFQAVIVTPQCRKDAWWTDPTIQDVAMKSLDQAVKEFHGDPRRIYLTGLSMGGYGSFSLAAKYPGKFAAIVAICGGVLRPDQARNQPAGDDRPYRDTSEKIGKTPVWIFHGADDPVVPVTESRRMADAMKAADAEVHYTEYPGVGHNSWDKAYAEPELISWLLSKSTGAQAAR